jgi:hypothetical protein
VLSLSKGCRSAFYPWTCLCLGLTSQITRTLPRRRMILHFSQIFFTEGLTFIFVWRFAPGCAPPLKWGPNPWAPFTFSLIPIRYSPVRQVVGRQLNEDAISRQYPDEVHADLTRNVREDAVPVCQLDSKHRIWQRLHDRAFDLDGLLLWRGRFCRFFRVCFSASRTPTSPTRH